MTNHPEVLPAAQQEILRRLGPIATNLHFYLAGRTAVAIHIGHRRSADLDWFTEREISNPLGFAQELRDRRVALEVQSVDAGTLHARLNGSPVSFFEYSHPPLEPPIEWSEYGCLLAAPSDLACMKLSAIAGRGSKKDFIDIYALGHAGLSLDRLLGEYQKRFQVEDIGHVLRSLTYFDDAESEDMPAMIWDVAWEDVTRAIEASVLEYVNRQAPP